MRWIVSLLITDYKAPSHWITKPEAGSVRQLRIDIGGAYGVSFATLLAGPGRFRR